MNKFTELHLMALVLDEGMYGRDQGDAPAGMYQMGDSPEMMPGSRTTTIDGQDVNEIWNELQRDLAAQRMLADEKTSLLTFPVTRPSDKVGVPRNPGFQEATEFGRPSKVRVENVARAYPLKHYDLSYGYTQEFLDYASGAEIRAVQAEILNASAVLDRNKVLEALFTESNGTWEALTIKRLYNGDGEVPPKFKRWSHNGNHTHYLTSAGASLADADAEALEEELVHHGFGSFGESLICLANRAEMDNWRGLTDWVPAASADRPTIITGPVVGGAPGSAPAGLKVEGSVGRLLIVEDNDIPAGYLLAFASGGRFSSRNPVGLRFHENPSARGLRLVEGPVARYPLIDATYDKYVGAAVRQRGAAVAMKITAGAYTDPTFDDAV